MKVYYHNDLDGRCAAAIAVKAIVKDGLMDDQYNLETIEINYEREVDLSSIHSNEAIWIVDFSFKPEVMEKILEITPYVTWIDHHKTALEYKYSKELDGIRDTKFSGCELTWKYLYSDPMPAIVEMLGRYDVWDFSKYGEDLNILQAALKLSNTDPICDEWDDWFEMDEGEIADYFLENGTIALMYREAYYKDMIEAAAFFINFEGYRAVLCNVGLCSSQLFDSVQEDYDIMMPFYCAKGKWIVSIYTKKDIDVSEIAKKYGGGGHKTAAGFVCEKLPWENNV